MTDFFMKLLNGLQIGAAPETAISRVLKTFDLIFLQNIFVTESILREEKAACLQPAHPPRTGT